MHKKDLLKFFCYIFLAICLIALIILGICSFFYYVIPIDFPGTVGEWITALSTLAGGVLTLGGVWWTINVQNDQRKEDLAIQYKPIINIEYNSLYESRLLDEDNNFFLFPVKIINHGRGEALNISIKYNYGESMKFKIGENFLTINNFFTCEIIFPVRVFEPYPMIFDDNIYIEHLKIKHNIFIEYFDIFNNKYIDTFSIYLEISDDYKHIIQYYIEKID